MMRRYLCPTVLLTLCSLLLAQPQPQTSTALRNRLIKLARDAQSHGLTTIQDPNITIHEYASAASLREALVGRNIPFLVEVLRKETAVTPDGNFVKTWYELKIIENITGTVVPDLLLSGGALLPPPNLRVIHKDSLLLVNSGGAVNIDGVNVTSPESPLTLAVGGRYLIFIFFEQAKDGHPTRTGSLVLGEEGAYRYDESSDKWDSIGAEPKTLFLTDLSNRSNGSLRALRTAIKQEFTPF